MKFTLEKIIQDKKIAAQYYGRSDILSQPLSGISADSRTIKPGELFFAILGDNFDGHDFVADVFQKGASACMVSRHWLEARSDQPKGSYLVVEDSLTGFQESAHLYRSQFAIPVVAITGSTGKTTVKEMTFQILAEKYQVLRNIKSFNNHIGVPLTLFKLNDSFEVVVVEIGTNHFGEIARLAAIAAPTHGLITNIGYGHLEFFGSLSGVARAKLELFDYIGKQGTIFYSADDETLAQAPIPQAKKMLTFGLEKPADLSARVLGCDRMGRYVFKFQNEKIALAIPGRHNVLNALAAIAIGIELGVPVPAIKIGLEKFTAVEKRMEVCTVADVTIINDTYNNNPTSAAAALQTLKEIAGHEEGRKIVVMGDMAELGDFSDREHARIGALIGQLDFSALFTFGSKSKVMADQAQKNGIKLVKHYHSKPDLSGELSEFVQADDIILVKGSRIMAMEEIVADLMKTLTGQMER